MKQFIKSISIIFLALAFGFSFAYAQGAGSGAQQGDLDRDQMRTHMPDEAGNTTPPGSSSDFEVDPVQKRDQDRTQDPDAPEAGTGYGAQNATTAPVRDQDRDRVQDPSTHDDDTTTPDQDRDRDRLRIHQETTTPAMTMPQFQEMVQERHRELMGEAQQYATGTPARQTLENQNRMREAVHALLASEDLVGGIGPQVSQMAQQMNQRIQQTVALEQQVHERGRFARFFVGGNEEVAAELEQEREQIREHVQNMQQLVGDCTDCPLEVKEMLQQHLQNAQQEQERLHQVAEQERQSRGLFDYLFGWLR